jgi:hypothetical protein
MKMSRYFRVTVLAAIAVLVLGVSAAVAQETTGSLRGNVKDDVGTPIAGAVVEATGPLGTLSTTTDQGGEYRYPRMAPGDYKVVAKYVGYLDAATDVRVVLGQAMTVDFAMQQSFKEEITVYSDTVAIDFTESQTETSIRQWEIDFLPRGRNYTDVVKFAAGTQDSRQAGGISIDGSSGLENRFVIDGIDTTDPQIGSAAIPMRAEMMEEIQVKSSGYMAEFGGSTGGVINAVTRSGGNEFHGALLVDISDRGWNGDERPILETNLDTDEGQLTVYPEDDEVRFDPGIVLSGPIIKDRLWFFGSYQPGIRNTERTVDFTNGVTDTYEQDFQVDYASLNLTANLGSKVLLKLGANISPYETDGLLPGVQGRTTTTAQSSYAPLGQEGERETYSLTGDWIATDTFVVSGRAGFYHTNVMDTGIPTFDLIHNYSTGSTPGYIDRHPEIPAEWQQPAGFLSDNLQTGVNIRDIYERTAFGIDASWFVSLAGEHSIKFGYQTEEIFNDVASGYNADRILYYWDRSYTDTFGVAHTGPYGYFRLLNISEFGEVTTRNDAIFVQDAWSVLPNLTLNIGLRAEHERVPNFGATGPDPAIEFDYGDKIAPRLGFAWDMFNDSKWKMYGSYGTYYDVTKYEMPRGSFGGNKWVDFFYTFDIANPGLNTDTGCRVGNNTIFDTPECGAGTLIEAVDRRFNSADPGYEEIFGAPGIDPDIQPMEMWEAQLGVDHQLTSTIQLGARYVHKELLRAIEDVGFLFPGIGEVYIIANPGEGIVGGPNADGLVYPKAEREYDALELVFEKRFSDRWSLRAYYTLSRLYGNYSGLANSDEQNNPGDGARQSPNVSRLYDTANAMYDANGELVYGELATNRTHQLGGQFLYSFDFGLSVGVTQYLGSGTPKSTIATVPIHSFFYPYGRGDLGETDWLTQTDLSLWQTLKLSSRFNFSVGLTILNLFDEDTETRFWTQRNITDLTVTDADFAAGGFDFEAEMDELGASGEDLRYGLPDNFQAPRDVRVTFKLEF